MSRAFIFPGQGAQTIGMGRDLAQSYAPARAVFEEVDEALGQNLSQLIWEGDIEELTLTANAQPALMATSMAAVRALEAEGFALKDYARFVAGHSLGEYSALCAAGSLSVADTARLLRIRGDDAKATPKRAGGDGGHFGFGFRHRGRCGRCGCRGEICQAANDNDPAQGEISGDAAAVERAVEIAKARRETGGYVVSALFHCALMQPAAGMPWPRLADDAYCAPLCP